MSKEVSTNGTRLIRIKQSINNASDVCFSLEINFKVKIKNVLFFVLNLKNVNDKLISFIFQL